MQWCCVFACPPATVCDVHAFDDFDIEKVLDRWIEDSIAMLPRHCAHISDCNAFMIITASPITIAVVMV